MGSYLDQPARCVWRHVQPHAQPQVLQGGRGGGQSQCGQTDEKVWRCVRAYRQVVLNSIEGVQVRRGMEDTATGGEAGACSVPCCPLTWWPTVQCVDTARGTAHKMTRNTTAAVRPYLLARHPVLDCLEPQRSPKGHLAQGWRGLGGRTMERGNAASATVDYFLITV